VELVIEDDHGTDRRSHAWSMAHTVNRIYFERAGTPHWSRQIEMASWRRRPPHHRGSGLVVPGHRRARSYEVGQGHTRLPAFAGSPPVEGVRLSGTGRWPGKTLGPCGHRRGIM
jgi:hypothetical protein